MVCGWSVGERRDGVGGEGWCGWSVGGRDGVGGEGWCL